MFLSAFGMERSGTEKADKNFGSRRKFLCQDLIWTLVAKRSSHRLCQEKCASYFFNLHTLFYKLIQGGNLEVLRVLLGHSSISFPQIYIHLAAQMQLVNNKFDSHLDTLT